MGTQAVKPVIDKGQRQMNTYHIDLIAEAGPCPITGKPLPELTEVVTIEAQDLDTAYRLTQVAMTIKPRGQHLRFFHNDVELFYSRPTGEQLGKTQQAYARRKNMVQKGR
jgi:hypothetical protein